MSTTTRHAPAVRPGHACRPHLPLTLLAAAVLFGAAGFPTFPGSAVPAHAEPDPTPTPLPTLSGSELPQVAPGYPRPEPFGVVFQDTSNDQACSQDLGEGAAAGVMVRLKDGSGNLLRQQLTNSYGLYDLLDNQAALGSGSYTLDIVPASGSGLSFRCAKPGTAHAAVQQSPVAIDSPGYVPADFPVNIGVN